MSLKYFFELRMVRGKVFEKPMRSVPTLSFIRVLKTVESHHTNRAALSIYSIALCVSEAKVNIVQGM